MGPQEYLNRVVAVLIQEGGSSFLEPHELELVKMAWEHAIGPADCACQITACRAGFDWCENTYLDWIDDNDA